MRHLTASQAEAALDQGRPIEQLVGSDPAVVEWLRLSSTASGITLIRHRVQNVGGRDHLDVYEFPPVDPEEEHGEGTALATFTEGSEALAVCIDHSARPDRWVADGVVQDEYADATTA